MDSSLKQGPLEPTLPDKATTSVNQTFRKSLKLFKNLKNIEKGTLTSFKISSTSTSGVNL